MFHIVLVEPEIPHNAGAAGRLALATDSDLHLIEPLGFSLEDKYVRRTGLDYWQDVRLHVWKSFVELEARAEPASRFWYLSTKAERSPWQVEFKPGDYLVFGRETKGLPESLLAAHEASCLTIPMAAGARSLNLATSAGIALYEAKRQIEIAT